MATMTMGHFAEQAVPAFLAEPPEIYTIHATRNDQRIVTHRIIPEVAVAQARTLGAAGWQVRILCANGQQYAPTEFHRLLPSEFV